MTVTERDEVYVCSLATNMVGGEPIDSIENPDTDVEATCARLYPMVRDTLLSKYEWSFAEDVQALTVDADQAARFGKKYAYKLLASMKSGPDAVYADGRLDDPVQDFVLSGGYIHCDYDIVHVRFRYSPPVSKWPPYFVMLVATDLASLLAKPVADNTALAEEMRVRAYGPLEDRGEGGLYRDAKKTDAKSKPPKSLFRNGDPLTSTRY